MTQASNLAIGGSNFNATMLITATTIAMIWNPIVVDKKVTDWVLVEQIGAGDIGFTWDGTVLTTNQPKPSLAQTV